MSAQLIAFWDGANWLNRPTLWLVFVVIVTLAIATLGARLLRQQPEGDLNPALLRVFNLRIRAWWMMCAILAASLILGYACTVILFGLISFWALREFITMTPTRRADHRALFWVFFILTPAQYVLVGIGRGFVNPGDGWMAALADGLGLRGQDLYGLYSIMIPVYASLFIPARIALSGDFKRFLERSAKVQAGLLICVYSLSHAPALLNLELLTWKPSAVAPTNGASSPPSRTRGGDESVMGSLPIELPPDLEAASSQPVQRRRWSEGSLAGFLFYFILIVQLNDVFQYVWGKMLGRRVIVPAINASRTWEGFVGGTASTTLVGALLWWVTPFRIWEAALMSLATAAMGSAGGLTISAIKRDRGVKDTGTLVEGHAGVLDRIDSLCFAAPVFFHLTRYYFTA